MASPPKTVLTVSPEEERAIRDAVRGADLATLGPGRVLASQAHVAGVFDLLADPAVSEPIYALPRPLTEASVAAWIAEAEALHARGEVLLILNTVADGTIMGYSRISVWPDRSAAELGGALRASLQNSGAGGAGAAHTIGWIFETLKVRLICLTAALDNVRSAKLIDRMGFVRMGERESIRPDGSVRRSLYWEMTREAWVERSR
ncbi:MAG: GNAT family N-acetyltransferase [Alphaproteobacteria bacterium]|nr:GNAT family N-acetyltransferase [Alphaproteobacteria bacterium]